MGCVNSKQAGEPEGAEQRDPSGGNIVKSSVTFTGGGSHSAPSTPLPHPMGYVNSKQAGEPEGAQQNVNNYYYAPVHNIREVHNLNSGTNYGVVTQNAGASSTSESSAGLSAAAPRPQENLVVTPPGASSGHRDLITLLDPILDASHTRNMKLSPPNSQCLPGTRKRVIKDICTWANSDLLDTNPHILWVLGYAGCGKSAIAHEIAKIFADQNRLAACFVFFRGSGDRSSAARFATTVASQVAAAIPETESIIESTVRRNRGLLKNTSTSLSDQFKHLVYLPVKAIASQHSAPFIVILDGVDECKDHDDIATLIQDTIDFFNQHPHTPLRLLIASRVEDHLHQVLHSSNQVRLLNLVKRTSNADIAVALDAAFEKEQRGRVLACDSSWPSAQDKAKLVKHIDGSFIFMTTIIRRLFDRNSRDGLTPMERLPIVLSMKPDFDELYKEILEPWQHLPHFNDIIGTIALGCRPLSIAELADIVSIDTANIVNVLINLHAIMQVPGDDRTPVTLWHTSLRDYLCAEDRSGSLFANPAHHRRLAYRCISVAAASANATEFPSSQYSRVYAIEHLDKLLDTTNDGPHLLVEELRGVMAHLQMPIFKDSQTALEVACRVKHWKLVHNLVNAGADVNIQFREPKDGIVTALHTACCHKETDMIYWLLEKGADPNIVSPRKDWGGFLHGTTLAFAAFQRDVKLVTRLLECGANPNLQGGFYDTALQAACAVTVGSLEVANLLLNNGADPNLQGGYWGSALHACAVIGHGDCTRALLKHKADPDIQNKNGITPLHRACYWGEVKVVECLLKFKADASIKNNKGQTALQVVQNNLREDRRKQLIQIFLRHGIVE